MEKLIYKVTKPYIYEGLAALGIDIIMAVIAYAILIVSCRSEYLFTLIGIAPIAFMAVFFDAPLLLKCLLDRKKQIVVEKTGVYFDMDNDFTISNKIRLRGGPESLLTTWYYPKKWNMKRVKPMFRTLEGKVFKPRCILSDEHYQYDVFMDIRGMRESFKEPILLKVKYLKYSKAILSIQMVSWPHDMKRRTKDYIDKNLSDLHRWSIKA